MKKNNEKNKLPEIFEQFIHGLHNALNCLQMLSIYY